MDTIEEFRESSEWVHSVGTRLDRIHFRERDGTGHAVCDFDTGECSVHEDSANPHRELFRHLLHDAPELAAGAAVTIASFWLWNWRRKRLPF